MKYFSLRQIEEALRVLRPHHAIFATTFLVLKMAKAPVGSKARFSLDRANREFLEKNYRVHPKSGHFFRVLRQGNPKKDWNEPVYAGKGLQSVNTRGCPDAFLHDKNDNTWGFSVGYVDALAPKLPKRIKLPLFHLAAWLCRDKAWPDSVTRKQVLADFCREYAISPAEKERLFSMEVVSDLSEEEAFQELPVKWYQILASYSAPQDVPPENSGILTYLETEAVGPVSPLRFEPARRLNIITGDNGLGKTFLLDLSWWSLTQNWAERQAWTEKPATATIKFVVAGSTATRPVRACFSTDKGRWELVDSRPTISGLVVYARVDGSFAIWDPANRLLSGPNVMNQWPGLNINREQVWEGKSGQIEGLLRDWVRWQERPDKYPAFATFQSVLKRVSPPDLGVLEITEPIRLPGELKETPTLKHPYGVIPIIYESAGIRRIITLAYLIVWAWEEHKLQAKQAGKKEERQMVVLLDEAEAHLHPKWQRVLLPALLGIAGDLSPELAMQLFVATHSPLVMASSEPIFDSNQDKLFHLNMSVAGKASFREIPFEARGGIDSWLSSSVFELAHPGSSERERAIREAIQLQEKESVSKEEVEAVTRTLRDYLAPEDSFWVRWVFFAEQYGVKA
jgi:hypothetical protein